MTITLRQAFIGFAVSLTLASGALAVMPPYTSYSGSEDSSCGKDGDQSQHISNQQVMQALVENKKLLQEVLQRLDQGTLKVSSAPAQPQTPTQKNSN